MRHGRGRDSISQLIDLKHFARPATGNRTPIAFETSAPGAAPREQEGAGIEGEDDPEAEPGPTWERAGPGETNLESVLRADAAGIEDHRC